MKRNKILATLMTLSLAASMCPVTAFAADADGVQPPAAAADGTENTGGYVLMNVPYDEFYEAELENNTIKVDAFTSATKAKSITKTLVWGSYHVNSDGSDITGVLCPVYVEDYSVLADYTKVADDAYLKIETSNRGQTIVAEYNGWETLFENESYSYYILGETLPEEFQCYKTLSVSDGKFSFSAMEDVDGVQEIEVPSEYQERLDYGDFEMWFDADALENYIVHDTDAIYGVKVTANSSKEGNGTTTEYGLTHMENIWLGNELSWSLGYVTAVHNCPMQWDHYESMQGQYITKVTYYTDKGIFEIPVESMYVPYSYNPEAAAANVDAGSTTLTITDKDGKAFSDFDVTVESEGISSLAYNNGQLTWNAGDVLPGTHAVTVSDKDGKYHRISVDLVLSTDKAAASYDENKKALVAANGVSADAFANYLNNITSVSVNGTAYAASGRGATVIINAQTGAINTEAASSNGAVFTEGANTVVVSATGYPDLSITVDPSASTEEPPSVTPEKKTQKIAVKNKTMTYTVKQLKKKARTFKIGATAQGTVSYTKANNKSLSVNKNGKVTVTKGLKKGTYKINVTIKADATAEYKSASVTKTIKVKVTK